jgi:hypothetical protein
MRPSGVLVADRNSRSSAGRVILPDPLLKFGSSGFDGSDGEKRR